MPTFSAVSAALNSDGSIILITTSGATSPIVVADEGRWSNVDNVSGTTRDFVDASGTVIQYHTDGNIAGVDGDSSVSYDGSGSATDADGKTLAAFANLQVTAYVPSGGGGSPPNNTATMLLLGLI